MADNLPVPVAAQSPESEPQSPDAARMSFFDHLGELRKRLMWSAGALVVCAGICWNFQQPIFEYLLRPLVATGVKLILLSPLEMFLTFIKIAIMGGALGAAPFILLQLWLFVAPGLYSHEKRWVFPFIFSGSAFFIGGAAFCFYLVLPATFKFMVEMVPMGPVSVESQYSVGLYFSLIIQLMLAFGAVFELPLIMVILAAAGVGHRQAVRGLSQVLGGHCGHYWRRSHAHARSHDPNDDGSAALWLLRAWHFCVAFCGGPSAQGRCSGLVQAMIRKSGVGL